MSDPTGKTVGSAEIVRTAAGMTLNAKVSGISPGVHGIHLHQTGKCEAPGFTTAGGHLNPTAHQHGTMNPAGPHLGDLPNIEVGADGNGTISVPIAGQASDITAAIVDSDGTAVVVHAGPDDYKTDPSGNSGGRIACGVLATTVG
ncbi:MAG: superoxide dismutase family protein [Novosphingobium sp.]|nr:superoxide dismutase family protein [Novosphingobium sp.]